MSFTVYPAIDLRLGKVVRLKEGDPERLTAYSDDPPQAARRWLEAGARWLHVVNLDGAFGENEMANREALRAILRTAAEFSANVQFGGGIRSLDAMEEALNLGVRRVVLGTVAAEQPEIVGQAIQTFGSEQIAAGIDARDGLVRVRGWKEDSGLPAADLALELKKTGVRTIIFTDIRRDGLGSGLNICATRALADAAGLDVIASGGVHTIEDVTAAREAGLAGTIIGRAMYEGTIDLSRALQVETLEG
jgi:phosphoribosylformimino-5-aminoimidazole carboxamide ribotide isomerase